jgi:superfamily II DNA or RNA helicase
MAAIARNIIDHGGRVLLLAHRGELLDQAIDKFSKAVGLPCAREQAESHAAGSSEPVTVGSVQSLMRQKRLDEYPHDWFTHVFIDEAHHAAAESYQRILRHFSTANVLGVTATPDRGDKKALSDTFDTIAYEYDLRRAVKDGWLCSIETMQIPIDIDLRQVKVSKLTGDYDERALGEAIDPHLSSIADEMAKVCKGRKTVVFLPLVTLAQGFASMMCDRGFRAVEVDGNSPDRVEVLSGFQSDEYEMIVNAMLLTEGWDCPDVDCIVILRPTKSRSLYCQMIGRGTRLAPNKEKLLVLDFLWQSDVHDLCRPASLLGASEEVERRVMAKGDVSDLFAAEADAISEMQEERDAEEERRQALIAILEENKRKEARTFDPLNRRVSSKSGVNPFKFALRIENYDIADYEPTMRWEADSPTEKQLSVLERRGFDTGEVTTKGLASKLINIPTPKQINTLTRKGFANLGSWSFDDASMVITMIADNNWRVPDGIDPKTYRPDQDYEPEPEPEFAYGTYGGYWHRAW